MGHDVDRFVAPPPEDIICIICKQVVDGPVCCSDDHLFCRECIEEWLKVSPTCPVDRQPMTSSDLKSVQRPLMSILMSLRIKCINYKDGCDFVSSLEHQAAHADICEVELTSDQEVYEEQLAKVQELLKSRRSQRSKRMPADETLDESDIDDGPPTEELNILILAETGVGKSTFINAFVNYITHPTLGEAIKAPNFTGIVPSSFTVTADGNDDDEDAYVQKKIIVGGADDNEHTADGVSATQATTPYVCVVGRTKVRLIDTPGIGDTRGAQQGELYGYVTNANKTTSVRIQ